MSTSNPPSPPYQGGTIWSSPWQGGLRGLLFCFNTNYLFFQTKNTVEDIKLFTHAISRRARQKSWGCRHCEEPKAMRQSRIDRNIPLAKQPINKVEYLVWIATLPLVVRDDVKRAMLHTFEWMRLFSNRRVTEHLPPSGDLPPRQKQLFICILKSMDFSNIC